MGWRGDRLTAHLHPGSEPPSCLAAPFSQCRPHTLLVPSPRSQARDSLLASVLFNCHEGERPALPEPSSFGRARPNSNPAQARSAASRALR